MRSLLSSKAISQSKVSYQRVFCSSYLLFQSNSAYSLKETRESNVFTNSNFMFGELADCELQIYFQVVKLYAVDAANLFYEAN